MGDVPQRAHRPVESAIRRPRHVLWIAALVTAVLALGGLRLDVDTDPENMLPTDEPVRVRNELLRQQFDTGPLLAVGVVADDGAGIATTERLGAVADLHRQVAELDAVDSAGVVSYLTAVDEAAAPVSDADVAATVASVEAHRCSVGTC